VTPCFVYILEELTYLSKNIGQNIQGSLASKCKDAGTSIAKNKHGGKPELTMNECSCCTRSYYAILVSILCHFFLRYWPYIS